MLDQPDRAMAAAPIASPPRYRVEPGGTLGDPRRRLILARVDRLVLLAPAVMFEAKATIVLLPERRRVARAGQLPFFHYAEGAEAMLNFAFYEDSLLQSVRHGLFAAGADLSGDAIDVRWIREPSKPFCPRTAERRAVAARR